MNIKFITFKEEVIYAEQIRSTMPIFGPRQLRGPLYRTFSINSSRCSYKSC